MGSTATFMGYVAFFVTQGLADVVVVLIQRKLHPVEGETFFGTFKRLCTIGETRTWGCTEERSWKPESKERQQDAKERELTTAETYEPENLFSCKCPIQWTIRSVVLVNCYRGLVFILNGFLSSVEQARDPVQIAKCYE
eukprot:TRINITY_DN43022_c0_g1_i1.p1 TRINITY_DN43022_c0_g1~~TRINITY_DN43022_c0_g1_i1.p1  ORF type:complete len:139 (-),score=21.45 TRINITY_DN43022_c0_g1_i1:18-434(-)